MIHEIVIFDGGCSNMKSTFGGKGKEVFKMMTSMLNLHKKAYSMMTNVEESLKDSEVGSTHHYTSIDRKKISKFPNGKPQENSHNCPTSPTAQRNLCVSGQIRILLMEIGLKEKKKLQIFPRKTAKLKKNFKSTGQPTL